MVIRRMVHAMGYRYRLHVWTLPGNPDLTFPRLRKIIMINGCLWHLHGCPRCRVPASHRRYWLAKLERNAKRDLQNRRALRRAGWQVLVVWECQITALRMKRLAAKIARFLEK
jgi:DNA mismatch endonuclease (patch repair protein)